MKLIRFRDGSDSLSTVTSRRAVLKFAAGGTLAALSAPLLARTTLAAADQPAVIASGVSAMPSGQVVWRVVRDEAQPAGDAEAIERALGFALATNDPLLVVDESNGTEVQLTAGEAVFVPESAVQRRLSLDGKPHSYLRVSLVSPGDDAYATDSDLIYANERFEAPGGQRIVELRSGQLRPNYALTLAGTGAPALVVAVTGEVVIETEGTSLHLKAGEAIVSASNLLIAGAGTSGGRFVVAQIGEVVAAADDEPTGGGIYLQVFACPPGIIFSDLPLKQATCAVDMSAIEFAVLQGPTLELTKDDLHSAQNAWGWLDLPFGYYELILDNSVTVMSANDGDALGEPYGNSALFWPITIGPDKPKVLLQVYATSE